MNAFVVLHERATVFALAMSALTATQRVLERLTSQLPKTVSHVSE